MTDKKAPRRVHVVINGYGDPVAVGRERTFVTAFASERVFEYVLAPKRRARRGKGKVSK